MPRFAIGAEARLGAKSQLTLPGPIVDALGIEEGDRFRVGVTPADPDTIILQRLHRSYAGALNGAYGVSTDCLAQERGSWKRG